MTKTKLVIADSDALFVDELVRYLERCPEFDVAGVAGDGLTALAKVQSKHPDMLLTEMLLPEQDGICLLKNLQKLRHPPMTICLSDFYSHSSIENARNNGASYYIFKPIDIPALVSILREHANLISANRKTEALRKETNEISDCAGVIYSIVRSMGFSSKYSGSGYIAESAVLACEFPLIVRNLSKDLYHELALRMHTSPSRIERSMRTAISAANENGRLEHIIGEAPTNKRCIQYILNELKTRK